jgi:hypothetical protein
VFAPQGRPRSAPPAQGEPRLGRQGVAVGGKVADAPPRGRRLDHEAPLGTRPRRVGAAELVYRPPDRPERGGLAQQAAGQRPVQHREGAVGQQRPARDRGTECGKSRAGAYKVSPCPLSGACGSVMWRATSILPSRSPARPSVPNESLAAKQLPHAVGRKSPLGKVLYCCTPPFRTRPGSRAPPLPGDTSKRGEGGGISNVARLVDHGFAQIFCVALEWRRVVTTRLPRRRGESFAAAEQSWYLQSPFMVRVSAHVDGFFADAGVEGRSPLMDSRIIR